ncbi:methionine--tRNA ligase [Candidatus Nomurabacteria bacterium]|nr:methionine--tRNA ligase [Candidatus Nomurabacteria bacterium]
MKNSFYITTTLPYVNADLHLGHALEFVRADSIARYKKLADFDVYFNTGTDEHGMKIFEKAKGQNISVQEFVDQSFLNFKESVKIFGMSDDLNFIRTTDKKHENIAKDFWMKCFNNGYIYKKNYETKYCVGCESEKTDSELNENGECPDHPGSKLEIIKEENYFFKYSAFTEKLNKFYAERPDFVVPDFRFNEIKSFVERGLQDFSISRLKNKMPWGIEVPNDSEHVMYVWFDALTNYISTLADEGVDTLESLVASEKFQKYWVNGNPTQYCGKDNLRFQSAMWQAMLMAADLPNSHQIIINGFIMGGGGVKMSKSLGNVINPKDIVDEYGTDALRFFLLSEISSFEDSPVTMERFKDCYNAKLANGLGNLTSRIMKMAETNFEKPVEIPQMQLSEDWTPALIAMNNFNITEAMNIVFEHVTELDETIQSKQPFKLVKTNKEEALEIIKNLVIKLHNIGQMLTPVLPETSKKIIEIVKSGKMPIEPLFLRKD